MNTQMMEMDMEELERVNGGNFLDLLGQIWKNRETYVQAEKTFLKHEIQKTDLPIPDSWRKKALDW